MMSFVFFVLVVLNLVGSALVISSSSWFGVWLGLELSGFSFPPLLLMDNFSKVGFINCWKYMIVQCYCSCVMVVGLLGFSSSGPFSFYGFIQWAVVCLGVFMKMGLPPFHGWVVHISNSISWHSFLLLSTIQKIGPLVVLANVISGVGNSLVVLLMMVVVMALSIVGASVNSIRYFLLNSSSLNVAWMIGGGLVGEYAFFFFMLVYFVHVVVLVLVLLNLSLTSLEVSLFYFNRTLFSSDFLAQLVVYSMIGIPPLVGFFMKTMVMWSLIESGLVSFSCYLIFYSSIFSYVYLTFMVSLLMKEKLEFKSMVFDSTAAVSLVLLIVGLVWFFG